MEVVEHQAGMGKYTLSAALLFCGKDLALVIGGGSRPHIGACALAVPRLSLDKKTNGISSSASVICVSGHKEDQLAREAALDLAAKYNCVVSVSVGIHLDDADKEDILQLTDNFRVLLSAIKCSLDKRGASQVLCKPEA